MEQQRELELWQAFTEGDISAFEAIYFGKFQLCLIRGFLTLSSIKIYEKSSLPIAFSFFRAYLNGPKNEKD